VFEFPNRLRVVDGELVMADGSDVEVYLKAWMERGNFSPDTPVTLMTTEAAAWLFQKSNYNVAS
jgi:hypothetical protein